MDPSQNFLTRAGSGQIFVALVGSGQPFWVWIFSPKNPKFFNFSPFGSKKVLLCHLLNTSWGYPALPEWNLNIFCFVNIFVRCFLQLFSVFSPPSPRCRGHRYRTIAILPMWFSWAFLPNLIYIGPAVWETIRFWDPHTHTCVRQIIYTLMQSKPTILIVASGI